MSRTTDKAQNQIRTLIAEAISKAQSAGLLPEAEPSAFSVEVPADRNNGDYSTNAAMVNARAFRLAPRKIAEVITENASIEGTYFEKIEIAVRSSIVNNACEIFKDPYWITDSKYFVHPGKFAKTISLIDKELAYSKEDFILHFKTKYSNQYPPAWILAEILPLGTLMNIYINL